MIELFEIACGIVKTHCDPWKTSWTFSTSCGSGGLIEFGSWLQFKLKVQVKMRKQHSHLTIFSQIFFAISLDLKEDAANLKKKKKVFCKLYGPDELYLDTIVVLNFPGVCIHFPVSPGDSTDMPKRPTGHQACPFWHMFEFDFVSGLLAAYILQILFQLNRQFLRWYWKKVAKINDPNNPYHGRWYWEIKVTPYQIKCFFPKRICFLPADPQV